MRAHSFFCQGVGVERHSKNMAAINTLVELSYGKKSQKTLRPQGACVFKIQMYISRVNPLYSLVLDTGKSKVF